MVPLVLLIAVGPLLAWKRGEAKGIMQRLGLVALLAVAVAVVVLRVQGVKPAMAPIGLGLAAWAIGGALVIPCERRRFFTLPRAQLGMVLAHAGLGIAIAGMTASALWLGENITIMHPGQTIQLAGYNLAFHGAHNLGGPNYTAEAGDFTLSRDGKTLAEMQPQRRFYPVQGRFTTVAAIHTDLLQDVYLSLGSRDHAHKGAYVVRLYHHPLVPWIWGGVAIMALGGIVSMSARRNDRLTADNKRAD
jgi:cytochrome c-type biogenesis protein CcmF